MLAFACRGLGGVVPEFDDMEVWRPGMPSFLLVYQTPCEGPCAALMDLWEAAAKKFPGLLRVLPRGRCPGAASTPGSTPRLSAVCELAFPEGSSPAEPDVVVWTGEKYERYAGRRSTEALMQAILEAGQRVASPAAAAAEVAFDSTVSDLGASGADARDWKATLLRSLSLFGRIGPRMGPDAQKPIVEEITRGLETCFEAVASRSDPKRAELLVGLARTGHYELALRFEARLDERFGSAPPPPDGATPLFVAALGGSLARVEALLATPNVDVDSTTVDGRTPLFAAASNGRADVVRALLRAGASVERDAWTPLRVASQEGHVARAWELLEEAGVRDDPDVAPVDALPPRGAARRPKIIHLTDKSRAAVPPKVFAQFRRFAPDHEVRFYDDEACRAYLATHFPPAVVAKYLELDMPAHRADLFRYGVMFVEGGVYLDVKTVLVRPLDEAFPDEARLYTVLSKHAGRIHQGILASPPRNRIFARVIELALATPRFEGQGATLSKWDKALYHSFTEQFYDVLRAQAAPLVVGSLSGTNVTLHAERCFDVGDGGCARGDRYGDCCTVRDAADRIHFVTRFQDYRLDESMDKMRLASELAEAGRRDEEKEALYSAVDAHQGNWRAMLLWGLALLGKPPAADRGQSPTFERAMWALQLCAAAVASPEPAAVAIARRAEMLELLAQSGHHDLARSFELFFDERMASAPPPAAAAAALEEARDAYVTLVTSDPLYGVGAEVLGLSIQAAEAERMEGLGGRGETRALVALVSNEPEMDGAARRLAAVGYDEVLRVETLSCAPLRGPAEVPERFETACTKLHVFNLTRFRTVLYLDADAVVTHETATSLFDRQLTSERPLAAAPDAPASSLFNTGVLVLKPSAELFAALLDGLDGGDSYDGADQGYLNGVFSEWYAWSATHRLSPRFNLLQIVSFAHEPTFRHYERQGVAVFQFVGGDKPWLPAHARARPTDGTPTEPYHRMWRSLADESWAITTGQRELSANAWAGAWKQLHRDIHARAPRASRPSARG